MSSYGNEHLFNQAAPSHDEPEGMSMVRQVFERASNAIVEASKLAKELEQIRQEVEQIKRDLDYMRARNKELDEMLATTRQQRDEARQSAADTTAKLSQATSELDSTKYHLEQMTNQRNTLEEQVRKLNEDLSQAMDSWHKSDQAKDEAQAKLKEIEDFAQRAFALVRPTQSTTPPANDGVQSTAPEVVSSNHPEPAPEYKPAANW
jgi:chromosome segregation ATPase